MNNELLEIMQKSRGKACEAKFHALEIVMSLECYYWTADDFQYHMAISHFERLVYEMAKFQTEHRKEVENV